MTDKPHNNLFTPGHTACAGCGQALAIQHVTKALDKDVVVVNATGCSEVYSSKYGESAWGLPWVHSLFENAAAVATGVLAALRARGDATTKVVAQGGDGATFDIGIGLLSGMWERGDNILYICYDNEAYMNTGVQASGATLTNTNTTTTPPGKASTGNTKIKKDMLAIALAHGLKYVATATSAYPQDIQNKVKKALATPGPSYLQILTPCVPGWGYEPNLTIELAKLAVQTGLYPIVEFENGVLTNKMKVPAPRPIEEYLKPQKRFKHLLDNEKELAIIRQIAQNNIKKYELGK
ncbi:MAG: thiamine pyrophosphate-dependent enzyme [Patescibacteria group bacterium]